MKNKFLEKEKSLQGRDVKPYTLYLRLVTEYRPWHPETFLTAKEGAMPT